MKEKVIEEINWLFENWHLSNSELARRAGVSRSGVDNYKNGRYDLNHVTLDIADKLYKFSRGFRKESDNRKYLSDIEGWLLIKGFDDLRGALGIDKTGYYFKDYKDYYVWNDKAKAILNMIDKA